MLTTLRDIAIGVLITVLGGVVLQLLGKIEISIPLKVDKLEDKDSIYRKAAEVLKRADNDLVVALDFPSAGSISAADVYNSVYVNALRSAISNNNISKQLFWYSESPTRKFMTNYRAFAA